MKIFFYLFILIINLKIKFIFADNNKTVVSCQENFQCVPLSKCILSDDDSNFIYPCHYGLHLICCPNQSYTGNILTQLENRRLSLFPIDCGDVVSNDKISGGKMADFGQFPWMALLGYKLKYVDYIQYLCGGSIISDKYILTAAHCINLDSKLELVSVKLGEHNLLTEIDCYKISDTKICADPPKEYVVERLISHENFNNEKLYNDIALIRVKNTIKFTDFIRPICLPFERGLETSNLMNQRFTVSGWGKTNAANLFGSTTLQYTQVIVWNQEKCEKSVPPEVKPLMPTQLCATGHKTEDSCKGDSGGPLINSSLDLVGELRYFQVGIVSFSSSVTCGNPKLPTIYTRLDKYLGWILDNIN